jgi:hypothetical protein
VHLLPAQTTSMFRLYVSITFLAFINLGNLAFAQVKDTILLYNGQVLIGEVKGAQYGEVNMDDADLKLIVSVSVSYKF